MLSTPQRRVAAVGEAPTAMMALALQRHELAAERLSWAQQTRWAELVNLFAAQQGPLRSPRQ